MLWIVQNNLYNEVGYARFISALERLNVNYLIVKPVPFTNKLLPADFDSMVEDFDTTPEPHIDESQSIIVCGATSLTRIARARGWSPGSYLNDNFDFSVWRDGFGAENILSGDAVVGKIKDIKIPNGDWLFTRPVLDSKSYAGMVMSRYDLSDWLQSISMIEEEDEMILLHKNTEIMIASAKTINAEYRLFVVDDEFITGSMYKQGSQVVQNEDVPYFVINFAEEMIDKWSPAEAFVIDIAVTPEGLKVIEINNINSAGFYAADVQKIIMALEDLAYTKKQY